MPATTEYPATTPCAPRRRTTIAGLRLVRESSFRTPADYDARVPIRSPKDVVAFMAPYVRREETETLWVLALDAQHNVIHSAPISVTRGILNSSLVHPREVFRAAIVANAAAIILVHNHPSGDVTPSADDRIVTGNIVSAGRVLDIPVHDHVIMSPDGERSSSAAGDGWI